MAARPLQHRVWACIPLRVGLHRGVQSRPFSSGSRHRRRKRDSDSTEGPVKIACQRHLFALPEDVNYLNSSYLSLELHSRTRAGKGGLEAQGQPWTIKPPDFFELAESVRRHYGKLMGTKADNIAFIPGVSYGAAQAAAVLPNLRSWNCAAMGVDPEPGFRNKVVVVEEQFPSNVLHWRSLADRTAGARVEEVPRPTWHYSPMGRQSGEPDWTDLVCASIDETTALVAVPTAHWSDGALIDIARVGRRCRQVGAHLFVDATQSAGAMQLDLAAAQPDMVAVAAYKWCLAPYSSAFLYVDPKWHDSMACLEHNWMSREGSRDFSNLKYTKEFMPGARRFDMAQRSNFVTMPMQGAAASQLLAWGIPNIEFTLGMLGRYFKAQCLEAELPVTLLPEGQHAPHILGLRFDDSVLRAGASPEQTLQRLQAGLAERNIFVSLRGSGMRVSPHLHSTKNDIVDLVRNVKRLLPKI